MSKSGLYAHFGSKEELQLATVETARQILDDEVLSKVEHIDDPLERLKALCTAFVDYVERRVFQGGCFFAAVEAEFDTHPGPVKEAIVASQQEWADLLEQLLADAKRLGEIGAAEDPAQLGFELNAYLLMGNTMFVLHDDASYLRRAQAAILRRLDEAS
jgi:AcrR family transcriptional regulator